MISIQEKIRNIIYGYFLCIVWFIIVSYFYSLIGEYGAEEEPGESGSFYYLVFISCIWAPIWEEAMYRYGPITVAKLLGNQYIMPFVIMSSCIFGWGHGESHDGVFIQGVLGLIFSMVYIKNNFSYISSVIVHSIYNCSLLFVDNFF